MSIRRFDLGSWLDTIKGDPKMVVQAASQAEKAADLVMEPSRQATAEPEVVSAPESQQEVTPELEAV